MAKNEQKMNSEIFSYEEYCVYELLSSKGITIHGHSFDDNELYDYDLCAPDGIPTLGLNGKTLVEVKENLSFSTIKQIGMHYETVGTEYNVLVVYFKSTVTNYPSVKTNNQGNTLFFISYNDLKAKYKKKTDKKKDDYYAEQAKKGDWKATRQDIIKNAKDVVAQGNNVLFLGAGVSMSAKMPSWNDLLKGLMGEVKQLKKTTLDAFKELNTHVLDECGDSYLIMARYLQTAIKLHDDKAVFPELIQKYLYNENNTSDLLKTLAHIVQQKKVSEVITYNFDDVLEQNLEKLNLKDSIDYTSISKDAEIKGHNTLPIYHVHGIIPQNGPVDTVVFSEEEYHRRYSNAFHWSNIEQLHALSRMHCFFVGLSMTDPNLRRLLDTAQNINKSNGDCHYAFLKRTQMNRYCVSDIDHGCKYVHVSESLIDQKKQKEIYDLNYTVIESIFMDLGVKVIWYEEFNELPGLLAEVFGLSHYQNMDAKQLITLCEQKIDELHKIEENLPKFDDVNKTITDIVGFMKYKTLYGKEYREGVKDVYDMLNELSDRIKWDAIGVDKIHDIQRQVPKFNESLSGFGEFYKLWLETVKLFYE